MLLGLLRSLFSAPVTSVFSATGLTQEASYRLVAPTLQQVT